jgi:hypothetical protein
VAHIGNRIKISLLIIGTAAALCLGCGNSNTSQPVPAGDKPGNASPNTNTSTINTNRGPETPANNAGDIRTLPEVSGTWINIPGLANKTPQEIEGTLGKSTDVEPVTEPPQEVPGEYRIYGLPDMKGALSVRFYKGKAVAFTMEVPKGKELKTAEELGKVAGFDLAGKKPAKSTDFMSQWNGQFGPAKFAEVTIGKSAKTDYNFVRARIQ